MASGRRRSVRWSVTCRLPSHPASVRVARSFARETARLAGFSPDHADDVEVAAGEAVTNAFLHAYGGRERGRISLELLFDGEALTVAVHDAGRPITGRLTVPDALPPPGGGGRGLYLIAQLMDSVQIIQPARRGRGIGLVMIKRRSARSAEVDT